MTLPVLNRTDICGASHLVSVRMYMQPGEMDVFIELVARAKPSVVVEFGVNIGITANELLLHFVDIERYIGIDVPPEYEISEQQRPEIPQEPGRLVEQDPRFELMVRRNGSFDLTPADLPMCDVAYIDADHRYKAVMHDSRLARRIVRQGGIIIWHDAANAATPDVARALEELHQEGWAIKQVSSTWLAFMEV
jgi:predicted O-methyltransferase YrrM